jgi:hypothetical protein
LSSDLRLIPYLRAPFGYSAALENVGTSAAPLLAGFAFALIGLTIDHAEALARPNVALLLLVVSSLALVFSVQAAFTARSYYVPPGDYVALEQIAAGDGISDRQLKTWYAGWLGTHAKWLQLTRFSYNLGIVVLFAGVGVTLVPPGGLSDSSPARLGAIGLAFLGAIAEAVWTLYPVVQDVAAEWRETRTPQSG